MNPCTLLFGRFHEITRSSNYVFSDFPASQLQGGAKHFGRPAPKLQSQRKLWGNLKLRGREIGNDATGRSCVFTQKDKK